MVSGLGHRSGNETIAVPGPRAAKRVHEITVHGDTRIDNYFYLRDRGDESVIDHCKSENEYVAEQMRDTEDLQTSLYNEMRSRIREEDTSATIRRGAYLHYTRTREGEQYSVWCRRLLLEDRDEENHTPHVGLEDCEDEEILLDENLERNGAEYYRVACCSVAPSRQNIMVFGEDRVGDEMYTLMFRDAGRGAKASTKLDSTIEKCSGQVAWASDDDQTLFYVTKNDLDRPNKVWRHGMAAETNDDMVFEEPNELYSVDVERSSSGDFVYVTSASSESTKVLVFDARNPYAPPVSLPFKEGVEVSVSDRNSSFYLVSNDDGATNFKIIRISSLKTLESEEILRHRENVKLEEIALFREFLVVAEREDGLTRIVVYRFQSRESHDFDRSNFRTLPLLEECYSLHVGESPFRSAVLAYKYSSLTTPWSSYETSLDDGDLVSVLKKRTPVGGDFDPAHYESKRLWATSYDGVRVPISLVYRRNLARTRQPTLLQGYGSYGYSFDPSFSSNALSLLDRGVAVAIAHIRGGGDLGRNWYLTGKYLKKKNTSLDFLACSEFLRTERISGAICISGRSAGGLLVGSALNMAPEPESGRDSYFDGAVLGVPFVDCLTTMLDESLPLTVGEFLEWGNPKKLEYYNYIKSYSPVDNVDSSKRYPPVFITGGLNDPRVGFWEPLKYAQRLREAGGPNVLCKIDMGAGHFSKSGRFDRLQELALEYSFILKVLRIT